MSVLDVENLLKPLSEDSPCGENLEYDASFAEMERAIAGKPEQQFGETVVEGEGPDWPTAQRMALDLFERTKDLRVAVHLTRAALALQGWPGFRDGLALTRGLVERFWEPVHPLLDPDDDLDPTIRVNTLAALADKESTVRALRAAPLVRSPLVGSIGLRQIELAKGDLAPVGGEPVPETAAVEGAFVDVALDVLTATAAAVREALEHAAAIEDAVSDRVGAGQSVQLGPLVAELKRADRFVSERLALRRPAEAEAGAEAAGGVAVNGSAHVPAALSGEVRSREDVERALDKICEYYERNEPSSPVPLLLQRAKRLASKSFIEILKDLTPSGLDQALSIGGITDEKS
jgi:type VI secretion system protein ImpA